MYFQYLGSVVCEDAVMSAEMLTLSVERLAGH